MIREPSCTPRTRLTLGSASPNRGRPARRGISVLWLVVTLPIFVFLFVGVVMIGNIWLARVELENALEAAALAAVKEWAENPSYGGDTLIPRNVGVAYAAANTISGVPVDIRTNYDHANATGSVNQNLLCDPTKPDPPNGLPPGGNLVFGAVKIENPGTSAEYIEFDAGTRPSCGAGSVTFDVSQQGQTNGPPPAPAAGLPPCPPVVSDNSWGVSFRPTENMPANITISRLVYDLRANGGNGVFDSVPKLSDNASPHKVRINHSKQQPDIFGFVSPPCDQISFVIHPATPWIMTVQFREATDGHGNIIDRGFSPCDRMRFGVGLNGVGPDQGGGSLRDDGDAVGHDGVVVAVYFAVGGQELPEPVFATFEDTRHRSNACVDRQDDSCSTPSMVVHPGLYPDVPCPPSSSPENNGQSLAFLTANGGNAFGVRAQAIAPVVNPFCGFCGLTLRPHYVTVRTTAIYDCTERWPRLIRVDEYICPGPK